MDNNHRGFHIFKLILVGLLVMILAGAVISEGKEKYFPLSKIKPGLSGYGYTVFQGLKIEKFFVKVLAVTENEKQPGRLILVRLSGNALEQNGGLSAGMSGSPVYIGGKLAGAVSYGFENADPYLAMVTPIEDMLKLMDDGESAKGEDATGHDISPSMGTPVLVSGMGPRGYEMVRRSLESYGLQAMAAPSLNYPNLNLKKVALEPGSAIGAQMVMGDYQMAAIGTVTMIDSQTGSFLAFGHPFSNRGTVDYLAVAYYIFQTVKSPVMSFKMGAPIKTVGRVIQDRQTGIVGRLGETPNLIEVAVNVQDQERRLERNSSFQVITDEQLYRDLVIAGVTDAVDQTINRLGTGTATVGLRVNLGAPLGGTSPSSGAQGATLSVGPVISRENLFFGKDIAADCVGDLQSLLDILAFNEYSTVPVRSVELDIKVKPEQVTARILKLSGAPAKVKPGETITVTVTAHSYRGADFTVPFEVKLPANLEPGKLTLTVRGGSRSGSVEGDAGQQKRTGATPDYVSSGKNSLDTLLSDYLNAPKNNEFVLEYQPLIGTRSPEDSSATLSGGANPISGLKETETAKPKPVQLKAGAGYYILGEAQLTLEVI
ncbi:MAG TPA: SpoIVB peptidase S55 domain-containing protein [Bacillota bacterium]|nr:SpoIVB peptidase S55 domain-containing protein [Bacillota bacterium]